MAPNYRPSIKLSEKPAHSRPSSCYMVPLAAGSAMTAGRSTGPAVFSIFCSVIISRCHCRYPQPRNTDRRQRDGASEPPADGKQEESVDFKTMVHAIHAPGIRQNPITVYGFRSSIHVYDEEHVRYPGDLSNCTACHTADGYTLPLQGGVLATSVDTGDDRQDPRDDTVTTPATAVCASCHDDNVAAAHMESNGGNFSTTQQAIDDGDVVEQCSVCHSEGSSAAVSVIHGID